MPYPQLYRSYSGEQVISFFGEQDKVEWLCNGQWLIFPATVICMTQIGERPKTSHFHNGSRFCWVADQPYQLNGRSGPYFVPEQVIGSTVQKRSIHLFVRPPQAQQYLYASELSPSYRQQSPSRDNYGMAWFDLKSTLPSNVWAKLGGLRLGDVSFAAVDQAIDQLRHPTTVADRLGILKQLVNYWHAPIQPEHGMSDAEIGSMPLPLPLRWWYRWAGKRNEVMSGQNLLLVPRDDTLRKRMLALGDGHLFFYAENQGVYQWCTQPHGDDPPVFGRWECKGPWARETMTLSEHLILMCLFEAVICHAKYGASIAWLEEDRFNEIVENIPPVAIQPWRWLRTRFFVGEGAFVCAAENRNPKKEYRAGEKRYYSVHVSAKTEHPLQFLKPFLDDKWEHVAI